jgi:hypothetical protein
VELVDGPGAVLHVQVPPAAAESVVPAPVAAAIPTRRGTPLPFTVYPLTLALPAFET